MVLSPVVGLVLGYLVMVAILWLFRNGQPGAGHPRLPGWRRRSRPRRCRWATACRTPPRRWASSCSPSYVGGYHDGDTHPALGLLPHRRRARGRHLRRWLADHAHPGPADHRARSAARLRRRVHRVQRAVLAAIGYGAPISTTHTITSAIMGVGATKRLSAVRWGVAGNIVTAWIFTARRRPGRRRRLRRLRLPHRLTPPHRRPATPSHPPQSPPQVSPTTIPVDHATLGILSVRAGQRPHTSPLIMQLWGSWSGCAPVDDRQARPASLATLVGCPRRSSRRSAAAVHPARRREGRRQSRRAAASGGRRHGAPVAAWGLRRGRCEGDARAPSRSGGEGRAPGHRRLRPHRSLALGCGCTGDELEWGHPTHRGDGAARLGQVAARRHVRTHTGSLLESDIVELRASGSRPRPGPPLTSPGFFRDPTRWRRSTS